MTQDDNTKNPLARSSQADNSPAQELKKPDFTSDQEAFAQEYISAFKDPRHKDHEPGKWDDSDILRAMSLAPVIFYLAMKENYSHEERYHIAQSLERLGGEYKLRDLGPDVEIEINMDPLVQALMKERIHKAVAETLKMAISALMTISDELGRQADLLMGDDLKLFSKPNNPKLAASDSSAIQVRGKVANTPKERDKRLDKIYKQIGQNPPSDDKGKSR